MRHTIREQQALKGIGQHKVSHYAPLTMDDVVAMVCLVSLIAWLIWLTWFAMEA